MDLDMTGTPAEFCASLRIFGIGLDFEAVSRAMGAKPSDTHRIGDRGLLSKPYEEDMWRLDSPLSEKEPLDAHLRWLRQALEPRRDYLRSQMKSGEVSSFCGVRADGRECSFRVSGEALGTFVQLGIDMDLSLIFLGYSDLEAGLSSQELVQTQNRASRSQERTYSKGSEVTLHVVGAGLDLSGMSNDLGLKASRAHHSADLDVSGNVHPSDLWSLTVPLPRTDELDAHLRWLRAVLLPHAEFLRSLKSRAELSVCCDFGTESDTGGVSISPEGLRVCTELDVPLDFSAFLI